MSKVRIVVSFSGGKDSQATLIYAVNKYGKDRVEAVFCDTGWEHPLTYEHVHKVCDQLSMPLTILKSKKYDGFEDMCIKKGLFPRTMRRFCTEALKVIPMIDWVLEQDDSLIILQGIRAGESASRAKMEPECMFFREYFDESGTGRYRKKDVKEWCKTHDASVMRPIFSWTAQQVIDYILEHGQRPNPLYERGVSRVGCFPCIMARLREVRIVAKDEAMRERLIRLEHDVNNGKGHKKKEEGGTHATFFLKGYIPDRYCKAYPNVAPTAEEVFAYVTRDDAQLDMFEPEGGYSCMSLYHGLCE